LDVRLTDTSLRDGSHAKRHKFAPDEVRQIAAALDRVGVPVIEVSHGDGLGGSSFTFGLSTTNERHLIKAAVDAVERAKIAVLILPGVGVYDDIAAVADLGASICRVATHCTEADIAEEYFSIARDRGMETVGFLMMSHTQSPEWLVRQARIMVDSGCQCVYVVDSAGALVLSEVTDRIAALVAEIGTDAQVGFHGHENLGLGVANSVLAIQAGAVQIDGSTRRFGAGAGNTPLEAFVVAANRIGIRTAVDALALIDVAEDVVRPVMDNECVLDRLALIMGYAGVYSSFLKHAYRVAERYNVSGAAVLIEAGRRRLVGGQEDQLVDIALELRHRSIGVTSQ
jgi:4-hydroxy 2-oxovalerate aldolase